MQSRLAHLDAIAAVQSARLPKGVSATFHPTTTIARRGGAEDILTLTEADGSNRELRGHGTIVSRRGPRGDWRIVLDDPLGPAPIDAGPAPEAGHG